MIAVLDYGGGNVGSVLKAIEYLGVSAERIDQPAALHSADKIIFPGQGHFGAMMKGLADRKMLAPLQETFAEGKPFLGICLGLQALYRASDEAPALAGLDLFHGSVEQLPQNVKLPHMGWNQLRLLRDSSLLEGIPSGSYFYFAHSYAAPVDGPATAATCEHGREFIAVLETQRIFGVQFHPEKSGVHGAKLLDNFLRIAA